MKICLLSFETYLLYMNSNLIKLILLLLVFAGVKTEMKAQSGWTSWERLYKDSDIQVEIRFKIPKKTDCSPNSKAFMYAYRVKGIYILGKSLLYWDLKFIDCNGKSTKRRISFEVGKNTNEDISNWKLVESLDYSFVGKKLKSTKPRPINPYSSRERFLHFGLGVGLEWMKVNVLSNNVRSGVASNKNINIQGLGLPLELTFSPLFKEYINFGFTIGGAAGTAPSFFDEGKHTNQKGVLADENLIFFRWRYGCDLAFGFKNFKLLLNYNNSTSSIDYNSTANKRRTNEEKFTFNDKIHRENIGFGIRLGSHLSSYGNENRIIDLLYTFTQNVNAGLFDIDIKSLFNSIHGLSIVWWRPHNFKWRADFVSANQTSPFTDLKNSYIYVGLTYNWDQF